MTMIEEAAPRRRASEGDPFERVTSRAYKGGDVEYPAQAGPTPARFDLVKSGSRFFGRLSFEVNKRSVEWTFDVSSMDFAGDVSNVAKRFSIEGSLGFRALTSGVPATLGGIAKSSIESIHKFDEPQIEVGLQTPTLREYFLSKGDELVGVLKLEIVEPTYLGAMYPWIATFIDSKFIPNAVLKSSAPMPPDGISALPQSLEKFVPASWRYWEHTGSTARKMRDALVASKILAPEKIFNVDGELTPTVVKYDILETFDAPAISNWIVREIGKLAGSDVAIVEVFSPAELAKADGVAFCDLVGEPIAPIAKSLTERTGGYAVSMLDSPRARFELASFGRVFKILPSPGVGLDAVDRLFVASFGVRSDSIAYVTKEGPHSSKRCMMCKRDPEVVVKWADGRALAWFCKSHLAKWKEEGARKEKDGALPLDIVWERKFDPALVKMRKAESVAYGGIADPVDESDDGTFEKAVWSTAYVNRLPDSAFLYIESGGEKDDEGKTKPRSLRHFPVRDESGSIDHAHLANAIAQAPKSSLPASVIESVQARGRKLLEESAEKADMANGGPGTLVPAQGVPEDEKLRGVISALELKLTKAKADGDERYVLGIVLEPDVVDAQKDIYSAETVRASAHLYMEKFQNTGLMHEKNVNEKVKILESYIAPVAMNIGGQDVKKGTWLMAVRVLDDDLWQLVKENGLTGFSIGGKAERTPDAKADAKHKADLEARATTTRKSMKTIDYQGIKLKIDRPLGTVQSGKDKDGNEWSREYKFDYGYIDGTHGGDDDGLDVFVGPDPGEPIAYWVGQKKDDGTFDEYKIFVGFPSAQEAFKAYKAHIPEKFYGGMREMTVEQMKSLLGIKPNEKSLS